MSQVSALTQVRRLETQVQAILRDIDTDRPKSQQQLARQLKQNLTDARLDIRDAEYADTGVEYGRHVAQAKKRLTKVNADMLHLSQDGIFSALEVAELGVNIEQIVEALHL